eukprot:scaffold13593_cov189-Alexandrium_tamarense.AAC.12
MHAVQSFRQPQPEGSSTRRQHRVYLELFDRLLNQSWPYFNFIDRWRGRPRRARCRALKVRHCIVPWGAKAA